MDNKGLILIVISCWVGLALPAYAQTAPNPDAGSNPGNPGTLLALPPAAPTTPLPVPPLPSAAMPQNPVPPTVAPGGNTPNGLPPVAMPNTPAANNTVVPNSPMAPNPGSAMPNAPGRPPGMAAAGGPNGGIDLPTAPKAPDFLMEPIHLGDTSLMYRASDIALINAFFDSYDKYDPSQHAASGAQDDLTAIIESANPGSAKEKKAPPPVLPNLYLGSIVYYSPSHWSVWINNKKIVNAYNDPANEFYVSKISRTAIELIWKPTNIIDFNARWQQYTNNELNPHPPLINFDTSQGKITLQLRPNQTFLPRSLSIREGLVKSHNSAPLLATNPGIGGADQMRLTPTDRRAGDSAPPANPIDKVNNPSNTAP